MKHSALEISNQSTELRSSSQHSGFENGVNRNMEQQNFQAVEPDYELDYQRVLFQCDQLSVLVMNDNHISIQGSIDGLSDKELDNLMQSIQDEKLCRSKAYVDGVLAMIENRVEDEFSRRQHPASKHTEQEFIEYTVQAGDNLWDIAEKMLQAKSPSIHDVGNLVDSIIEENLNLVGKNPDLIYAGQTLRIRNPSLG